MTEHQLEHAGEAAGSDSTRSRAARVGRHWGMALYFLLLIFIVSAGSVSIIGQVYGLHRSPSASIADEKSCAIEIRRLKRELLDRAGETVANPNLSDDPHPGWLAQWDQQYLAMEENCGRLESARIDLRTLRDKVVSVILRFRKRQAPLIKRIEAVLDKYPPQI